MLSAGALATASAHGDIRSAESHPLAMRGGTLMIPLIARDLRDGWPGTLDLTLEDGRIIRGVVAWVETGPVHAERPWTQPLQPRLVRAIQPGDAVSDRAMTAPFGPCLLAELPTDGSGLIRLGRETMQPTWLDPAPPIGADRPALALVPGLDRPDPSSPFDHWRWALLAERLDHSPPGLSAYGEIGALVARHQADLWRHGLARLERRSRGVAARCRELLTQTCRDGEIEFAGWITDPAALAELLSILLDQRRDEDDLVPRALQWADARDPLLWWVEREFGDHVQLAIGNLDHDRRVARFTWPGVEETPIAALLEPWTLNRATVDRPLRPAPPGFGLPAPPEPDRLWLHGVTGDRVLRAAVGPRALEAAPPGLAIGPLLPTLTLAEAWSHQQRPVAPGRATTAVLRRIQQRWELFIDCRREAAEGSSAEVVPLRPLDQRHGADDLRSLEAVTLHFGPAGVDGSAIAMVCVPETGAVRMFAGRHDGSLVVHRRSLADRWYCRIVVPDSWLGSDPEAITALGLIRTHGDSEAMETAPGPVAPWLRDLPHLHVSLGSWSRHPPAR
jgi:hypothetical protein